MEAAKSPVPLSASYSWGGQHLLQITPDRLILLAPVIFLIHLAESAPGFVGWINGLIATPVTARNFFFANTAGFIGTIAISLLFSIRKSDTTALVALAWVGFLMPGCTFLSIGGAMLSGSYAPGLISCISLYLPFTVLFFVRVMKYYDTGLFIALLTMLIGAIPMVAYVYYILFNGDRLF